MLGGYVLTEIPYGQNIKNKHIFKYVNPVGPKLI